MANTLRNEVAIQLGGVERTLRADFTAIMNIEAALRKSMIGILNQIAQQGDLSITEAATIIHHGLIGFGDTRLNFRQVGEALMEVGISNVLDSVIDFVRLSINGVSLGKPEPETAK